jgi:hypothetical protein
MTNLEKPLGDLCVFAVKTSGENAVKTSAENAVKTKTDRGKPECFVVARAALPEQVCRHAPAHRQ